MPPSAAVWPTSDCLAAGCGELVKVWQQGDPTSEIKIFEGTSVSSVDFSRNNKVLAVAGDKGQVVLYSNRPQPPNGDRAVGRCPDIPKAGLDCITCVRFAASDTHLIGGARNGTVRIWSLRSKDVHKVSRSATRLQPCFFVTAVITCRTRGSIGFRTEPVEPAWQVLPAHDHTLLALA